ncbi:BrnA antitoxin family protein [Myxococcota bacterium]|nr:BrnA antitoxin family protein [Myxococcota bacterium]
MKKYYDFSKGKPGAVIPTPPGKTRITIRIDDDVLDWFREQVDAAGGGNYQTMMNRALRGYMESEFTKGAGESLEEMLRRVIEEVIPAPRAARSVVAKAVRRKATRSRRA